MMLASDIQAWVEATRPTDWYGKCAGLTDRVVAAFTGGPRQWYDSATDARHASGALNPDASACPAGGIHFWSYYGRAWDGSVGNWGHVTIDITGGGSDTLSATHYAHESWGVNAGLISVTGQSARPGMTYLGWARTYGDAAPLSIGAAPAGSGSRPFIIDTPKEETDMRTIRRPGDGGIHFADELGAEPVLAYISPDIDLGEYLPALDKLAPGIPGLTDREHDIMRAIAERRSSAFVARISVTVAAQLSAGVKVDEKALAASLAPLIGQAATSLGDAELRAIAEAVADEQAKRLAK